MSQLDNSVSSVSATGLVCLSLLGPDAVTFLQGQLTCDMRPLAWQGSKGGVSLAARLNLKGRVMASLWVLGVPDGFLLILPETQADSVFADLKKYVLFSKAKLTRETWSVVAEDAAAERLTSGEVIKEGADVLTNLPHVGQCLRVTPSVVTTTNQEVFELVSLRAGIAMVLPQTAGLWLPQELAYDTLGAVSYNKGCYLGQEIVARLHFKGGVKQHLYCLELAADTNQPAPSPAAVLQDAQGSTLGQVVQACGMAGTSEGAQRLMCLAVLRTQVSGELVTETLRWRVMSCQMVVKL